MPTLASLKSEVGPKGLVLVGATHKYGYVSGGEEAPPTAELRYIEEIRKRYYSAVIEAPAVVSEDNFRMFGVSTTPTLALPDRHGIVRFYHPGAMTYEELRSAIEGVQKNQ